MIMLTFAQLDFFKCYKSSIYMWFISYVDLSSLSWKSQIHDIYDTWNSQISTKRSLLCVMAPHFRFICLN